MRIPLSLLLITGLAAAPTVSASGASVAKSPQALYAALLTTPIKSGLPDGLYSAKVGIGELSKRAKKFHAVGEVDVDIDSGDAALIFIVLPSRSAAVADWNDSKSEFRKKTKSTLPAPGDLPWPAIIGNASITGKNAFGKRVTNGTTIVAFTSKNVIVEAITISTQNEASGDIPGAIKLARFGLKHLNRVRG